VNGIVNVTVDVIVNVTVDTTVDVNGIVDVSVDLAVAVNVTVDVNAKVTVYRTSRCEAGRSSDSSLRTDGRSQGDSAAWPNNRRREQD
jgi:hypothetical protein